MIGLVVFDLDDTLYLERHFVSSGYAAVGERMLARHGIPTFAERAEAAFARGERARIFDTVLAELGHGNDNDLVQEAVLTYRAHSPRIALTPDAQRYLRTCVHPIALLSDGEFLTQRNKVVALGLDDDKIDPVVLTGAWGREYWKPHMRGFEYTMARHSLRPEQFVYVADNPSKDFVAPRALGWRTVRIARPGRIHVDAAVVAEAERVITSLDELGDCLSAMARA